MASEHCPEMQEQNKYRSSFFHLNNSRKRGNSRDEIMVRLRQCLTEGMLMYQPIILDFTMKSLTYVIYMQIGVKDKYGWQNIYLWKMC